MVNPAPTTDDAERPDWACHTHPRPRGGNWTPADRNYRTCAACLDRIRAELAEVRQRYAALDPRPGHSAEHGTRGAPGFASRAPGSDHVIAMRDPRSRPGAVTWRGSDKRLHRESTQPPLSVPGALAAIATHVHRHRGLTTPVPTGVDDLARWIDSHLDWITRQPDVALHAELIHRLATQLRPVTGEPGRRPIGRCPNTLDSPTGVTECGVRLYAPLHGDTIECRACGRQWHRPDWERLGLILTAETNGHHA